MRRWVVSFSFLNNCIRVIETSSMAVVNYSSKSDQEKFINMTLGLWSQSVAYLEMFLQSVRNGAAPLQIPSDDILTEKTFCNLVGDSIVPSRVSTLCSIFQFLLSQDHISMLADVNARWCRNECKFAEDWQRRSMALCFRGRNGEECNLNFYITVSHNTWYMIFLAGGKSL